ncbi:hypothetical protein [Jannaschia aquimarina]|uniref:Uncharacterized protein n=1 Tax=Jannaschia aquimarina TaxID=935700 RepID=A0A0D1ECY2_9RHOB|nr:hypothetical protein [Jannaschia aquimarina]KIT15589.1 hypothetical protein jaqu_26860 [Jannaschia aquimarina]SNT27355.1 hypothetical protein SAMN05421775_109140 [Jannaschia aquimarina]
MAVQAYSMPVAAPEVLPTRNIEEYVYADGHRFDASMLLEELSEELIQDLEVLTQFDDEPEFRGDPAIAIFTEEADRAWRSSLALVDEICGLRRGLAPEDEVLVAAARDVGRLLRSETPCELDTASMMICAKAAGLDGVPDGARSVVLIKQCADIVARLAQCWSAGEAVALEMA